MSDTQTTDGAVASSDSEEQKSTSSDAGTKAEPRILKVHGKEFDVSTEVGFIQAQTWAEALATTVGKQGKELGDLRSFKAERAPSESEKEIRVKAKQKAAEGDLESALDLLLDYSKETELKLKRQNQVDKANSELWEEYFVDRTDLVKQLGRDRIKKIAEASLDLYKQDQDVFKTLDEFFMPLARKETPKQTDDKAPKTLSGSPSGTASSAAKTGTEKDSKKEESFEDILDSRSFNRKK